MGVGPSAGTIIEGTDRSTVSVKGRSEDPADEVAAT